MIDPLMEFIDGKVDIMGRPIGAPHTAPFADLASAEFRHMGHRGRDLEVALEVYAEEVEIGPYPTSESDAQGLISIAACSLIAMWKAEHGD